MEEEIAKVEREKKAQIEQTYRNINDHLSEIKKPSLENLDIDWLGGHGLGYLTRHMYYVNQQRAGSFGNMQFYATIANLLNKKNLADTASKIDVYGSGYAREVDEVEKDLTYGWFKDFITETISDALSRQLASITTYSLEKQLTAPEFYIKYIHEFLIQLSQFCEVFECPITDFGFSKDVLKQRFTNTAQKIYNSYLTEEDIFASYLGYGDQLTMKNLEAFTQRYLNESEPFQNLNDSESETPES